jgi:hypothetical protein
LRIAAICTGVVPQQPPMMRAPSSRACAANSAKYSGVACGKTTRSPARLASPTFAERAQDARRLLRRQLGQQRRQIVVWQPLDERGDVGRLEVGDDRCPVGRPDALGQGRHAVGAPRVKQLAHILEESLSLHRRSSQRWVRPRQR